MMVGMKELAKNKTQYNLMMMGLEFFVKRLDYAHPRAILPSTLRPQNAARSINNRPKGINDPSIISHCGDSLSSVRIVRLNTC